MALRPKLELVAMAVIMALFLKGFLIDAYKIPTGSMQPTLIGDRSSGISDRILVDRVSYAFRDPRRFEVIVFRYPLDRSRTYVKRVVGIGPEEITLRHGDLFRRAGPDDPWAILRRPEAVQERTWLAVDGEWAEGPSWVVTTAGRDWQVTGRTIEARGDGRAEFLHERGAIRDWYLDGYEEPLRSLVQHRSQRSGRNAVGDLRLDATVTALRGARSVGLELFEGGRRYLFHLPGPAADEAARPRIEAILSPGASRDATAEEPWRLPELSAVRVRAQNLDDRLELRIEGREPLELAVEPARDQTATVSVRVLGEGADLTDLTLYRDVYYTAEEARRSEYVVPAGSYFVLGDNSQDSSDSRDWMMLRFGVPGRADVVRGEARRDENPRTVNAAELEGPTRFFRDEWGEDHWLGLDEAEPLPPEHVPFVARELIVGRAVAVFWPLDPFRGVFRLGFVR